LRVDPWVVLEANYVINSESVKLLYDDLMLLIMIMNYMNIMWNIYEMP